VRLRPAAPADAGAVRDCVHAAYRHYVERIGRPPGPMLDDYAEVVRTRQVHVAEADGRIVGVLVLDVTDEGFLLENIAVDPSIKGTGVGKRLLELAEAEARRQGHASLYLYTHEKMTENQALYARIGYEEYARRTENGLARVFMRKRLA
jgi:N-acetylglutamate synthase-like GNAT family acetyltransferase